MDHSGGLCHQPEPVARAVHDVLVLQSWRPSHKVRRDLLELRSLGEPAGTLHGEQPRRGWDVAKPIATDVVPGVYVLAPHLKVQLRPTGDSLVALRGERRTERGPVSRRSQGKKRKKREATDSPCKRSECPEAVPTPPSRPRKDGPLVFALP